MELTGNYRHELKYQISRQTIMLSGGGSYR